MAQFTKCCNCLENAVVPIEYIFLIKKEKNRKEYFCLQYEWKNEDDILEKEQLFSEITVEDIPHWTDELKKGLNDPGYRL